MKIKLYRANDKRLDAAEIAPETLKTLEDWNRVDVILVYDAEAYDWLKAEGERLDMYTPCDFYSRDEVLRGGFICSEELYYGNSRYTGDNYWVEVGEAMVATDDDRWFYTDIRKCP